MKGQLEKHLINNISYIGYILTNLMTSSTLVSPEMSIAIMLIMVIMVVMDIDSTNIQLTNLMTSSTVVSSEMRMAL